MHQRRIIPRYNKRLLFWVSLRLYSLWTPLLKEQVDHRIFIYDATRQVYLNPRMMRSVEHDKSFSFFAMYNDWEVVDDVALDPPPYRARSLSILRFARLFENLFRFLLVCWFVFVCCIAEVIGRPRSGSLDWNRKLFAWWSSITQKKGWQWAFTYREGRRAGTGATLQQKIYLRKLSSKSIAANNKWLLRQ